MLIVVFRLQEYWSKYAKVQEITAIFVHIDAVLKPYKIDLFCLFVNFLEYLIAYASRISVSWFWKLNFITCHELFVDRKSLFMRWFHLQM